ncbi:hypothetical protein [Sphingomicrobium arenosum]|uniref:hypothetical protein n=1 Tax=Sphingomicrobium arenosum TaxID=2233861 RepID=UPI00224102F2|nr:hypothetical protein [Sphingomicrobium arenosum]
MSNATRFLALIVAGWVGLRVLGTGLSGDPSLAAPPASASDLPPATLAAAAAPPAVPTDSAPLGARYSIPSSTAPAVPPGAVLTPYGYLIPFAGPPGAAAAYYLPPQGQPAPAPAPAAHTHRYEQIPIPLPYAVPQPVATASAMLDPALIGYSLSDGSPLYASASSSSATAAVPPPVMTTPAAAGTRDAGPAPLDRWQLSGWSFTREAYSTDLAGTPGLAPGSMLGGDQAGVRLIYNHNRRLGLAARLSSATGAVRGDEVALGLRYTPVPGLPLALTAERREAIGEGPAARSAFAFFAETGLYGRPLGRGLTLDAYAQAGLVGITDPDLFIDGAATASLPLWRKIRLGGGLWGAAQPGASRLDIGPRLSMPVYRGVTLHADYRQQLAGNARPGSGPALTLAADF